MVRRHKHIKRIQKKHIYWN